MAVKHWSFAGLLLTYWCSARCACCYVCGSPEAGGEGPQAGRVGTPGHLDMTVEAGLALWEGLQSASPHGCRIHIGGGEPFGRWQTLIELARRARRAGLGPLQAVETNAFWASEPGVIRDRLAALDEAGMGRLTVSCDPYHQQFVPLANVRLLARLAEEVLGGQRVLVRWRDWAGEGFDTDALPEEQRRRLFVEYARRRRLRLSGRAAVELAGHLPLTPAAGFADNPCNEALLRSRHVHVDGEGNISPGTCAGILLGRSGGLGSIADAWRRLRGGFADHEVIGPLARSGPAALLEKARRLGYQEPPGGYASKCHLCWTVRQWLFNNGYCQQALGPAIVYRP